jgi:hypothetical protein
LRQFVLRERRFISKVLDLKQQFLTFQTDQAKRCRARIGLQTAEQVSKPNDFAGQASAKNANGFEVIMSQRDISIIKELSARVQPQRR